MANPQKENGYTGIANEIIEKLSCANLNGSEFRIILFVLRKTYGFQKTSDFISLTQFERGTGMKRGNVCETLKSLLVVKRLLLKANNLYKFNKNWNEWVVVKRLPPSSQKHNQVVVKRLHTKETIQKKVYIATKVADELPAKEEFNFQSYLDRLKVSKNRYLNILRVYWINKEYDLKTKDQVQAQIKRDIRAAKDLVDYPNERIVEVMEYCKKRFEDWKLETVGKYINNKNL